MTPCMPAARWPGTAQIEGVRAVRGEEDPECSVSPWLFTTNPAHSVTDWSKLSVCVVFAPSFSTTV